MLSGLYLHSFVILNTLLYLISVTYARNEDLPPHWESVRWLIGTWNSQFDGKMVWPTVPTLTYGEHLELYPAPLSVENSIPMLKLSGYSWSHSTKDHLLDTFGYMTIDPTGNATLLATMNNGFSTYESGPVTTGLVNLQLREIGRMSIARQLPVEDMNRQFRFIDNNYMEQIISMRTTQHPQAGMQEHARILYEKIRRPNTEPPSVTIAKTESKQQSVEIGDEFDFTQ